MADSISPTPRNSLLGLLADALQSGHDFASRPRHPAMPETGLLSETLGIPSLARTLDRMSYGEPLTTGRGQTTRIRDDTTNALMAMAPMAQGASKAAPALGRAALSGATVGPRATQRGAINVFHGSPHSFDKFDMSKIGTGEGAQAYGHGLYFADNPAVAKAYADNVKNMGAVKDINAQLSALANKMHADEIPGSYRKYRTDAGRQAAEQYDALMTQRAAGLAKPGNLYETRLAWPDAAREAADPLGPQHFLQWDKPLSEQPANVQAAIQKTRAMLPPNALDDLGGDLSLLYGKNVGADDFLGTWNSLHPNGGEAALKRAGIPGIRYLDGGSRGAGAGTANYVVFDDALAGIMGRR